MAMHPRAGAEIRANGGGRRSRRQAAATAPPRPGPRAGTSLMTNGTFPVTNLGAPDQVRGGTRLATHASVCAGPRANGGGRRSRREAAATGPPRPGPPAAERPQVEPAIADERLQRLQGLITGQQREIQNSMVGRDVSVLVEKTGREAGQMVGKSEYLHSVHIDEAQAEIGDVVRVRIVDAKTNSLTARQI